MAKYTTEPKARVIADSVSPAGHRLTTMEVTMNRFVLAEFNTHRVFSRNSASSRAIPGHVQRVRALRTPAMPLEWPQKLAGMQGGEALGPELESRAAALWREAAADAVAAASKLDDLGVHKSVTNRLLEPFLYQTVLVTSTEWSNFFAQRCSTAAQPEIQVPAELMLQAHEESEPVELDNGQWHTPLAPIDDKDAIAIGDYVGHKYGPNVTQDDYERTVRQVSVARCARVSYLNHDGDRNIEDDLKLYDRLATYGHWSPFEHVATPCPRDMVRDTLDDSYIQPGHDKDNPHLGNFTGWDQLRHEVKETQ